MVQTDDKELEGFTIVDEDGEPMDNEDEWDEYEEEDVFGGDDDEDGDEEKTEKNAA